MALADGTRVEGDPFWSTALRVYTWSSLVWGPLLVVFFLSDLAQFRIPVPQLIPTQWLFLQDVVVFVTVPIQFFLFRRPVLGPIVLARTGVELRVGWRGRTIPYSDIMWITPDTLLYRTKWQSNIEIRVTPAQSFAVLTRIRPVGRARGWQDLLPGWTPGSL